jgi:hypothetical protein
LKIIFPIEIGVAEMVFEIAARLENFDSHSNKSSNPLSLELSLNKEW